MSRRDAPLVLALLAGLVGLGLRLAVAERQGLWVDEVFSLAMATGHSLEHPAAAADPALGDFVEAPRALAPSSYRAFAEHENPPCGPGRVVRAVRLSDTNPPLYYLLLHGWTRVAGTSDLALRGLSIAWAALCMPLMWGLGRRLGGRRAASAAVILFAFDPLCVYYSTEGRMYSQVWFFALLVARLTLGLHRRGAAPATLAAWVLASAAGLMTHYLFAFTWAACAAWIFVFRGRCRRLLVVLGVLATFLIILPWYSRLPESLAAWRVTKGWEQVRPDGFNRLLATAKLAWSSLSSSGGWWGAPRPWLQKALNGTLAVLIVTTFALAGRRPWMRRPALLIATWLLGAALAPLVLDVLRGTFVSAQPRYASAAMPAILLVVAAGLRQAGPRAGPILLAMILACWNPAYWYMLATGSRAYEPYVQIGRLLTREAGEADLILVHSIPSGVVSVARYLETGPGGDPGFSSWVGQLNVRQVPDDLERLGRGRRRIILIRVHAVGQSAPQEDWLYANCRLLGRRTLQTARISYFEVPDGWGPGESPGVPPSETSQRPEVDAIATRR